eukprot:scaffold122198_cov18-Tisochrysis_lutea.AAC.1
MHTTTHALACRDANVPPFPVAGHACAHSVGKQATSWVKSCGACWPLSPKSGSLQLQGCNGMQASAAAANSSGQMPKDASRPAVFSWTLSPK